MLAHRGHDISDRLWNLLSPHLPGSSGSVGRPAEDNRLFINAVFWILRTGAPWRDLPPDLGVVGRIRNVVFVVGVIEVCGKNYWIWLLKILIMSG